MAITGDNQNLKTDMSIYHRLWVYSYTEEEQLRNSHLGSSSKKFRLGVVVVNGIPKNYTSIIKNINNIRFPDSIVITKGDIRKVKYTDHVF